MIDRVLQDLALFFHTTLTIDANNTCLLEVGDLKVHIEANKESTFVIVGILLDVFLPPGAFREQVATLALKWNFAYGEHEGIFALDSRKNSLIFYDLFPIDMEPAALHKAITSMIGQAAPWKEALARDHLPDISLAKVTTAPSIFGLR